MNMAADSSLIFFDEKKDKIEFQLTTQQAV